MAHEKPMWMREMELELFLGNSHRCHDCGHEFLAHSDGCSKCGGHRTSKLHKVEAQEWDMETYPVIMIDPIDLALGFQKVNIGDRSQYPKV